MTKKAIKELEFSFHKYFTTCFYLFLFFNYFTLSFFFYTFFTHDIYPHPHPWPATHTHDPRPLPTTHDPRNLATLPFRWAKWTVSRLNSPFCKASGLFVCCSAGESFDRVEMAMLSPADDLKIVWSSVSSARSKHCTLLKKKFSLFWPHKRLSIV